MTAFIEQLAIGILARFTVIDAIAVADVEAVAGAKAPDRVLHKPRKHLRKSPIKGAGVDLGGDRTNDLGTAAMAIAGHAIAVGSARSEEHTAELQSRQY